MKVDRIVRTIYTCEICGTQSYDEQAIAECEKSHCKKFKEVHICLPDGKIEWTPKLSKDRNSYPSVVDILYEDGVTVRYKARDTFNLSTYNGKKYEKNW